MSCLSEWLLSKSLQKINAREGAEKREPSYTVGGNANQYSHYEEQYGDSLKNWNQNCHRTQQSHYWAYTPRKPELKDMYPTLHHSTFYNSQDMEATDTSTGRQMNKKAVVHSHNSAIKENTFESVLMKWMKLGPVIQSEVSQQEKYQYSISKHIYGIQKDADDDPICKTAKETQM